MGSQPIVLIQLYGTAPLIGSPLQPSPSSIYPDTTILLLRPYYQLYHSRRSSIEGCRQDRSQISEDGTRMGQESEWMVQGWVKDLSG